MTIVAAAAIVIVAFVAALDRFDRLPGKKKSSSDAAAELLIQERTISRLRSERDQERNRADKLEATRSLEPILAQLEVVARQNGENAEINRQVLDRLVHHNGSFRHMEESMGEMVTAVQTLSAFVATLQGLPVAGDRGDNLIALPEATKPAPRPRRKRTP